MSQPPDQSRDLPCPPGYAVGDHVRGLGLGGRDPTFRLSPTSYAYCDWFGDQPAAVEVHQRGDTAHAAAWGPGAGAALDALPRRLGLHQPEPAPLTPRHPALREMEKRHRALRMPQLHSFARGLVPTILGQKVTWQDATRAWRALVRQHGQPAPGPLELTLPPAMPTLARRSPADLRLAGIPADRARTVLEVARRANRIDRIAAAGEVRQRLHAIRGLGPWTLEMTLGTYWGDPDAVPTGDAHLPNMVAWNLAGEPRADDRRMLALLEPWRGRRYRVIQLLFAEGAHAPRRGPKLAPRRDPRDLASAALPRMPGGGPRRGAARDAPGRGRS